MYIDLHTTIKKIKTYNIQQSYKNAENTLGFTEQNIKEGDLFLKR